MPLFLLVNVYFVYGQCVPSDYNIEYGLGITKFKITGDSQSSIINESNPPYNDINEGYTNYFSTQSVNVTSGSGYDFMVTNQNNNKKVKIVIWMTDDSSGNFTQVYDSGAPAVTTNFSGTITIAPTTLSSATLRVVAFYYTCDHCNVVPSQPCDFTNNDIHNQSQTSILEIEDYTLNFDFPNTPEAFDDELLLEKNSSGTSNQINVGANDNISIERGDGDDFSIATNPTYGQVIESTAIDGDGIFEYVPNTDYVGNDSFTYSICDSQGNCDTATVNIAVNLGACTPVSNSYGIVYIKNVSLTGENSSISNPSGDDGGYGNYLNTPSADMQMGKTYTIYLTTEGSPQSAGIFIDYNQDGKFNISNELTYVQSTSNSIKFTVPDNVLVGTTVMRVAIEQDNWLQHNGCGELKTTQEFEDYFVNIYAKNSPSLVITGNNNSISNGSTTTSSTNNTNFGSTDAVTGSLLKTFSISNTGNGNIELPENPISLSGATSDFTITAQPTKKTTLAGNKTATFEITFTPTSTGLKQATVIVQNDDPIKSPYTFLIEGRGISTNPVPVPDPTVYPDTDGDGITDNIDIDDDNDGILDEIENSNCQSNPHASLAKTVFLYETFGTGTDRVEIDANFADASTTYQYAASGDVNDGSYTVYQNAQDIAHWADKYWYKGKDHTPPDDTNGRMAIFNAEDQAGGVFYENQITGVTPGVEVTYSFAAINLDRVDDPSRSKPEILMEIVDPNGFTVIESHQTAPIVASDIEGWVINKLIFKPTISAFTVRLSNLATGGLGNDLAIDDIRVEQLFCDSDGDGVADVLDIDDDNDGIPTLVELGLSDDDNDGTLYGNSDWDDANNDGVHDSYPTGATLLDFDGDGVPNYLDLDSDNDGVFDDYEYDGLGEIDVTGDGAGDGPDTDGDGALDTIDNFYGFGLNGYTDPIETTPGTPDYLNVKSDGTNFDIPEIYAHLDTSSPKDGTIDDNKDTDSDGLLDVFDTDHSNFGSPRNLNHSYSLYFDGINDYVEESPFLDNTREGTMMCWVKIDPTSTTTKQFIMGQLNINFFYSSGRIISDVNKDKLIDIEPMQKGEWTHLACTYKTADSLAFFLNGELKKKIPMTDASIDNDGIHFVLGHSPSHNSTHLQGEIDEVRVFNRALTETELKRMVYQELDDTNNFNSGRIIPLDIASDLGSSLIRYYKMDTYLDDKLIDITNPSSTRATIYNAKNIYPQTAPLPYETTNIGGDWSDPNTWLHGDVWDITTKMDNPDGASIIHVKQNLVMDGGYDTQGSVGIIVDRDKKLSVEGDKGIYNSWYLNIDDNGIIDLQGESQLIQTEDSTLGAGTGTLERDQQGTANLYTYNYWSSPVNTGSKQYTVGGILKDGSDGNSAPIDITYVGGYNGSDAAGAMKIASYWLYKFENAAVDNYYAWKHVGNTGSLKVGQGYSMKGTSASKAVTDEENYTFKGIPNNGEYTLTLDSGNEYLVGNPYPSALDANTFLTDNQNTIDGTLYFWDHHGGGSHYLKEYEGGYGMYNLSGSVGSPADILNGYTPTTDGNDTGKDSTKTPQQYIPVGQGFFVKAKSGQTETTITFNNGQRVFEKEGTNSVFMKSASKKDAEAEAKTTTADLRPKIRLNYKSPKGYLRQLLTTVDKNATIGKDWGYDGAIGEDGLIVEDMYWEIENEKYVIQGIDTITKQTVLPLTVKTKSGGLVEINIAALENVPNDVEVYLKDYDTYHDLRASSFLVNVAAGEIHDRFEIAFSKDSTLDINEATQLNLELYYSKQDANLIISNPNAKNIESLKAVNMLGQVVFETQVHTSDKIIRIPTQLATGMYVFTVNTNEAEVSKKVIVSE
ncbi:LamG-like jellyroll fold domain-containing protein [Pseudotamlana haliotis]|nr:LamG-like jellyroll fold domain-containing protein [Tamlana haliotis]